MLKNINIYSIKIYVNKIENGATFKIKQGVISNFKRLKP